MTSIIRKIDLIEDNMETRETDCVLTPIHIGCTAEFSYAITNYTPIHIGCPAEFSYAITNFTQGYMSLSLPCCPSIFTNAPTFLSSRETPSSQVDLNDYNLQAKKRGIKTNHDCEKGIPYGQRNKYKEMINGLGMRDETNIHYNIWLRIQLFVYWTKLEVILV